MSIEFNYVKDVIKGTYHITVWGLEYNMMLSIIEKVQEFKESKKT